MRPSMIRLSVSAVAALLALLAAGITSAQPAELPTYGQAPGVTFESVEPGVWKVIDPKALSTSSEEHPEWHRGLEVAPDGTVWVWGPGGIRELGGSPVGDESFDPDEWADATFPFWSRAHGFAIGVDGTVWAILDSQLRSYDGNSWKTHTLDWATVAPRGADRIYAYAVQALPDGTVWATWEAWYDDGLHVKPILASFDSREWTVQEVAEGFQHISAVAGTADGDVWLLGTRLDAPMLLRRSEDEWQRVDPPSSLSSATSLAIGPDDSLWTTMSRPDEPGCDMPAHFAEGIWRSHTPDRDDGWCVYAGIGLQVGPDGSVWFPGLGVVALDDANWRHYLDDMGALGMGMSALDLDVAPDGKVWVASAEGVFVIDPAVA